VSWLQVGNPRGNPWHGIPSRYAKRWARLWPASLHPLLPTNIENMLGHVPPTFPAYVSKGQGKLKRQTQDQNPPMWSQTEQQVFDRPNASLNGPIRDKGPNVRSRTHNAQSNSPMRGWAIQRKTEILNTRQRTPNVGQTLQWGPQKTNAGAEGWMMLLSNVSFCHGTLRGP